MTKDETTPMSSSSLADPLLALAADILDDLEQTKIANENRLRQLTRTAIDKDGEERGFGLTNEHPDVAALTALVDLLAKGEHQAVLNLQRKMRQHPLGPWIKAQRGMGDKQTARLLAAIGDPYINSATGQPRMVSQLWAYCGLHVDNGAAVRRQRGQKSNWSSVAKSRAYLVAKSMRMAGNRETYDKRRNMTQDRVHEHPCVRCGPAGKPAQPGTPWSKGHQDADALRFMSKELLKQLWHESKRLHEAGEIP